MARKMFVTSDISIDARLAEVADRDPQAALAWPWLIVHLDDWGRGPSSPRALRLAAWPGIPGVDDDTVQRWLDLWSAAGLIVVYGPHLCVPPERWWRYQTHIRSAKRDDDSGSHHPTEALWMASEAAKFRESGGLEAGLAVWAGQEDSARDPAESRENARNPALHHATPHHLREQGFQQPQGSAREAVEIENLCEWPGDEP